MVGIRIGYRVGSQRRGASGPRIAITASSILESAVSGSTVGVLSVVNGEGSYTFTKTADPDSKFVLSGANLNTNAGLDFETATSHSVTVTASKVGEDDIVRAITISVTNVFEAADLGDLGGTFSLAEDAAQGDSAGTLTGRTTGSTLTLIDNAGGRVQLDGTTIEAGPTALDYEAATSHSFTVRETLADSSNSPRDNVLSLTVTDVDDTSAPLDFIGYGQSNWLFHVTNGTGAPAANADTFVWNGSAFVAPTGNGVRTFLNAMQAATGRVCRLVSGGQGGVAISALQKGAGTDYYEDLLADVVASGIDPAFIIFHHGEGDASTTSPTVSAYQSAVNTLHTNIATDTGKTLSQLPFVLSSLGRATDRTTDDLKSKWDTIQRALATINSAYPNVHYSHSNVDAALVDSIHWEGPAYGRSGARYAQTVQFLQGTQTDRPQWFATAAERVSTTTTDITVVDDMGTDFTPTTGITGFEVSDDNGSNWEAATGARIDASTIRLTHGDMGTVERLVRYQYGTIPNVTAPVLDNSALVNPLNYTVANLVAEGAVALPTITFSDAKVGTGSGAVQTATGFTVPGSSEELLVIFGQTIATSRFASYVSAQVTAQPSGTVVDATLVVHQAALATDAAIFQAIVPSDTTSVDIRVEASNGVFATSVFSVSTIPTASLSSTTAVDAATLHEAAATSVSADIATSAGGVLFAIAAGRSTSITNGSFSGDETIAEREDAVVAGGRHMTGDASNTSASAASTVTATFDLASDSVIAAASWR